MVRLLTVAVACSTAIGKVSFAYWGSALALSIAAELVSLRRKPKGGYKAQEGYRAGDLGLDPFGLADDEVCDAVQPVIRCILRDLWRARS